MASQIAHIVYAKKFFDALESGALIKNKKGEELVTYPLENLNKDEFLLGCVFPDIRRIDENIKRKDTHLKFLPLNMDFKGLTSFQAGWKFHLFCDMRREEILNDYKFYSIPCTSDIYNFPSKIVEDEIIYNEYNNWEKLNNYFNNPPFIEAGINVEKSTFNLWYAINAKYIKEKPHEKSMRSFLSKQIRLPARLDEIMEKIILLRRQKNVLDILEKVAQDII